MDGSCNMLHFLSSSLQLTLDCKSMTWMTADMMLTLSSDQLDQNT